MNLLQVLFGLLGILFTQELTNLEDWGIKMNIVDLKSYLISKGFEVEDGALVKTYEVGSETEDSEKKKYIKLKYVVKRPWVHGYRIDSVGRAKLFSKGKLKNISISEDGTLIGFEIKTPKQGE